MRLYSFGIVFITLAGLPTAMELDGMSFTTTDPAPIVTLFPIVIFPITLHPTPRDTLLPITGRPFPLVPIVVHCPQEKLSPIDSAFRIVEKG
nr:hypothetical protein [Parabacteroides sp. ZJ-118]